MTMHGRNKRKERSSPEPQTQPPSENSSSSCLSADNLSPPSTMTYLLPPGFKFMPSDEQVIFCYLKPYLDGNKNVLLDVPIHLVNIYESNPQQLSVEFDKGNDKEWFIITERNKVDQGLSQTKRVGNGGTKRQKRGDTKGGYWHATVGAHEINAGDIVGYKTAFAYYVREQSADVKTDWLMLEYSLYNTFHNNDKDYTLCKIYLTPQATKKKKKEVEEQKNEEGVISVGERSSPEPQRQPTSENPSSSSSSFSSLSADNLSPPSTIAYLLPPSYKFLPADEEVIFYYLKPYLDDNKNILLNVPIHLVNLYKSNPQLLSVEFCKGNDKEWFIITERNKVDQGLSKTKRVGNGGTTRQKRGDTKGGYWHATVGAQEINAGQGVVGYKTAFAYYVRKQSADFKTDWLMLEYSLHHTCHNNDKDYTLCKIYLTPQATKKKKEVEAQNKKQKKGQGVISVAPVEALEEQQPLNVEYPQPHQSQALLDSYQPQPHDIAFPQPQFSQCPLDSQQPQPHDLAYKQPHTPLLLLDSLEGLVSFENEYQQEQQSHMMMMQDSRSRMAMTSWRNDESTQEDLLDMLKDDRFFSMDELFNDVDKASPNNFEA
ncbi:uncharacterized protein LOC9313628 isoform X2 [Arabidopsis lyrata subsp. lyrata]|uniref:uncharacterized protein LOC9313628 isoform X2 n=1 Tax=Arabidopsis lyrata subsp. lyrata TaxID=81972 RepID=UPI000A29B465|nr:uncharacterized protein LOC9313628 isoform X2 [Arabidopsis lyrata subsp. lyrata]|eukprot:XP_020879737.1 uncharacterized protein LOC9313628 isoform X2 [Arabidopsis lyrata subsp. lyrata]